jgi:hypothetical protein
MLYYFLIGIAYLLINALVRKIYDEGQMIMPFIHMMLWPLFILTWIVKWIIEGVKSIRRRIANHH